MYTVYTDTYPTRQAEWVLVQERAYCNGNVKNLLPNDQTLEECGNQALADADCSGVIYTSATQSGSDRGQCRCVLKGEECVQHGVGESLNDIYRYAGDTTTTPNGIDTYTHHESLLFAFSNTVSVC